MVNEIYIISLLITGFLLGVVYLFRSFPGLWKFARVVIPKLGFVLDKLEIRRKYRDPLKLIINDAFFKKMVELPEDALKDAEVRAEFVRTAADITKAFTNSELTVGKHYCNLRRLSSSLYTLIVNHKELADCIKALSKSSNIQVKKTTLLAIDVLGELFDLEDRLDRDFFQHLIYGLNKVLLQLRDGGYTKRSVSQTSVTLWRIYQLTRAYSRHKNNKGLTRKQFEKKVVSTLGKLLGKDVF